MADRITRQYLRDPYDYGQPIEDLEEVEYNLTDGLSPDDWRKILTMEEY